MLIDYIDTQRKKRGWSIRELASRADISHSGLAKNLRGDAVPSVTTVEKLASALEVDSLYMFELLSQGNSDSELDPSVRLIAKRLSSLPTELRLELVNVFGVMLDVVTRQNKVAV